jgi:hypothetical protein
VLERKTSKKMGIIFHIKSSFGSSPRLPPSASRIDKLLNPDSYRKIVLVYGFVTAIAHVCTSETKSGEDRLATRSPAHIAVPLCAISNGKCAMTVVLAP